MEFITTTNKIYGLIRRIHVNVLKITNFERLNSENISDESISQS